jgi:hypothetical protein
MHDISNHNRSHQKGSGEQTVGVWVQPHCSGLLLIVDDISFCNIILVLAQLLGIVWKQLIAAVGLLTVYRAKLNIDHGELTPENLLKS